ncbi:outer membrane lipoprotein-sorting protein [Desulfovibrio ferrophilus]|uniref:Uncharacterized protein TP-0789 domain-containing protein n=1 Tax=Desulfovibrio ferrophilus TaxID=241368 RepID=A0A2Z6AVL2_9BACT|nr:outer membrane lipoprotein-sorting protein [Desulfovibrio ferrophilus]BBD07289.1 uncharacterized protein DFE_0563 [Desulfovibrio ferrophilus]
MYILRIATLILASLFLCPTAFAEDLTARQIMERQKELHEAPSEKASLIMILVDRKGTKKKRTVRSFKKTLDNGLSRSLMIFTEPADLEGTSILSVETEPGKGSQWLFLPATKSMQRISSSSKTDYFMGTDLTYEDMESDDLDNFEMALTGSETLDNQDCWVIEVTPASDEKRKASGYSKRVFYIRKDIVFTVKTEFFDRRGRELKIQTNHDLENIRGDMWMAKKTLIDNKRARHKTLVGLAALDVDAKLDDDIFTERFVSSGRRPQ